MVSVELNEEPSFDFSLRHSTLISGVKSDLRYFSFASICYVSILFICSFFYVFECRTFFYGLAYCNSAAFS